ncbi:MAG: glycosyltransferase family 39 protein [Bacteroidales bacterium]|jgi:hypothetical protein
MLNKKYYPYIIAASAILFFIPFLGSVHLFDWDEINFAESAREMIVTGNFSRVQVDFHPFWEKPPLFFWMQAGCMNIFGINEFAARLPDALFGIISLLTFYFIGKKLKDEKFGLIWSLAYMGSFLPHLYFKSGIIDPVYNYFIFLTIFFIYLVIQEPDNRKSMFYSFLGGVSIGLATLTKGPVGFLVISLSVVVYWITVRFKKLTGFWNIVVFAIAFALVSSLWFGLEVMKHGLWFLTEFIKYQVNLFLTPVAGHGGPVYYHFVVVFLGCFPISVIALPRIFGKKTLKQESSDLFLKWMVILFWVVMILFTIVKTKIVHYSSLTYFPLSFIAAYFIYELVNKPSELKKWQIRMILITGSIFSILLIALPLLAQHRELLIPLIRDKFAVACLSTNVKWSGLEFLTGLIYFIILCFSIVLLSKEKILKGFIIMFYATSFCMFFYLLTVVPGIEKYSQGPAIDFYKSIAGRDVYVGTEGFYSYAPFFYFQKKPGENEKSSDREWLLNGPIDKPAYLVAKVTSKNLFDKHPDCVLLKQEGGFLFYLRMPVPKR